MSDSRPIPPRARVKVALDLDRRVITLHPEFNPDSCWSDRSRCELANKLCTAFVMTKVVCCNPNFCQGKWFELQIDRSQLLGPSVDMDQLLRAQYAHLLGTRTFPTCNVSLDLSIEELMQRLNQTEEMEGAYRQSWYTYKENPYPDGLILLDYYQVPYYGKRRRVTTRPSQSCKSPEGDGQSPTDPEGTRDPAAAAASSNP